MKEWMEKLLEQFACGLEGLHDGDGERVVQGLERRLAREEARLEELRREVAAAREEGSSGLVVGELELELEEKAAKVEATREALESWKRTAARWKEAGR